jgi:hypothetical protein
MIFAKRLFEIQIKSSLLSNLKAICRKVKIYFNYYFEKHEWQNFFETFYLN